MYIVYITLVSYQLSLLIPYVPRGGLYTSSDKNNEIIIYY